MELVACTGEAAQAHALEAVVSLQVREPHLDLLALISRFGELRRHRKSTSLIASILVNIARNFSEGHIGRASEFDWAAAAVVSARAIQNGPALVDLAGRLEQLTSRADVYVTLSIERKVAT